MAKAFPSINNTVSVSATWLVITSGTLYGFLGLFGTQLINDGMAIATMLFWRFLIAAVWMGLWELKNSYKVKIKQNYSRLLPTLTLAGLFYAGSSVFYFYASHHIGTGLAMVIFFAYPIFIAIAVCANNNWRLNKISLMSLSFVVLGLLLLQRSSTANINVLGIVLALTASLSYALYIYKSKTAISEFSSGTFTLLICLISATFFLTIAIVNHKFAFPISFKSWLDTLALGVLATALPIQFLLVGLKSISMLKASILSALEPVVTLFVGVIVMHEVISSQQLLGVVIIIAGTIIIQFSREH